MVDSGLCRGLAVGPASPALYYGARLDVHVLRNGAVRQVTREARACGSAHCTFKKLLWGRGPAGFVMGSSCCAGPRDGRGVSGQGLQEQQETVKTTVRLMGTLGCK